MPAKLVVGGISCLDGSLYGILGVLTVEIASCEFACSFILKLVGAFRKSSREELAARKDRMVDARNGNSS